MSIVLPSYEDEESNDYIEPSPRQVLRIAINLKNLIDRLVPSTLSEKSLTAPDSLIVNDRALQAVYQAAGGDGQGKGSSARRYQAALVFCLLKVAGWYESLMQDELSNNGLWESRLVAAETIAAALIDRENDDKYLFLSMLCHRYTINLNDVDADDQNVLELAVDMHVTGVISSSGYQRCMKWLWRGWIVQSSKDTNEYVLYRGISHADLTYHLDPDRIKTPLYQNILEIFFSVIYLAIYTVIINSYNIDRTLSVGEYLYYAFTIGFAADELFKFVTVGWPYIQFSNAFSDTLYALVLVSMSIRISALYAHTPEANTSLNIAAYRLLSMAAPMMWTRMLLFLDVYPFVGTMVVVIKRMMKESLIFFVMLAFVLVGFLQAFLGLDQADGRRDLTRVIVQILLRTVLGGPDFDATSRFAYPYGSILYYAFTFIVVLILLNVLIALYSQAYSDVVENATSEYLAQYSSKILKYIRAPDEKTFCPPLNLVEIVFLELPLGWWLDKASYSKLCDIVMGLLYAPYLAVIATYEAKAARRVQYNRSLNMADDANEIDTEWNLYDGFDASEDGDHISDGLRQQRRAEAEDPSFAADFHEWRKSLAKLSPPIEASQRVGVLWQDYRIYKKIEELEILLKEVKAGQ